MATYCWYWLDSSVQHTITFPLQYPYWYWYGTGRVVCLQYTGGKLLLFAIYFCFFTYVMWSMWSFIRDGRGMAREINHLKCIVRSRIFVFRCICSLLSVRLRTEENMTWQILLTVAHFSGAGGAAGADTETPGHFIFLPTLSVMYCSNK